MPETLEKEPNEPQETVQIDVISAARMEEMTSMEKIHFILDGVRDGKVVILESGLTPDEESKLIEVTMTEISPDGFSGIDIETHPRPADKPNFINKIFGEEEKKLTVIGPANQIQTLHKDSELISALVSTK